MNPMDLDLVDVDVDVDVGDVSKILNKRYQRYYGYNLDIVSNISVYIYIVCLCVIDIYGWKYINFPEESITSIAISTINHRDSGILFTNVANM